MLHPLKKIFVKMTVQFNLLIEAKHGRFACCFALCLAVIFQDFQIAYLEKKKGKIQSHRKQLKMSFLILVWSQRALRKLLEFLVKEINKFKQRKTNWQASKKFDVTECE